MTGYTRRSPTTATRSAPSGRGFTYSAHPVAAAVAIETLKIYEERDILTHIREVAPRLQDGVARLARHPLVGEGRGIGLVGAIEVVADREAKTPFDPSLKVGPYVAKAAEQHGVITRAIGDVLAFSPPLIIEAADIDQIFERMGRALDDTQRWLDQSKLASVA